MSRSIALALLLLLSVFPVSGQDRALIDIQGDVKVINVSELGLPASTQVSMVLEMLPELMARPGDDMLGNYSVIVDGLAAGYGNNAVLSQLTIADIESIRVSQNSIASYQSNGQSGSIEISLKSAGKGFSSNGAIRLSNMFGSESNGKNSHLFDIIPKIQADYAGQRFSIRLLSLYERYNPMTQVVTTAIPSPAETVTKYEDVRANSSMNVIWGEYRISESDKLNMSFAVITSGSIQDKAETSTLNPTDQLSLLDRKAVNAGLTADYRHTFADGSVFRVSGNLKTGPEELSTERMSVRYGDTVMNVSLAGKAEYKYPFRLADDRFTGTVAAGVNANAGKNGRIQTGRRVILGNSGLSELETDGHTSYVMPYVTFQGEMNGFSMSGYINYEIYSSRITREHDRSFNIRTGSLTGKVVSAWEFVPGQKLRIMYGRDSQRPSATQTYPFAVFDPQQYAFVQGNGALRPVVTDELTGDFISQLQTGDRQFVINMGLGYMKVSDVIASSPVTINQGAAIYDGITYDNAGANNIAKINSLFMMKQRGYTASVTANMFYNIGDNRNASSDHYTYCNLGMNQSLKFGNGWGACLGIYFNSPIFMNSSSMGKLVHSQFAVSRDWKHFSLDGVLSCPLSGNVTDRSFAGSQAIETTYPLVRTSVSVVARYHF
ncbi:MAG: outer membrane beta-barrel family protein [Bacteroidaceae bacterium]|nr:outer membrane beta-barrel family protein [Bacteroidaceae bacterium]